MMYKATESVEHYWKILNSYFFTKPLTSADDYDTKRIELIESSNAAYFTVDVGELTESEKVVDHYLQELRNEVVQGDHSPLLLPYYEGKSIIEKSSLHTALTQMPKGAHLHLHPSAGYPMEVILELTRKDNAYFSLKKIAFAVLEEGETKDTFVKCNTLREEWTQEGTFDEFLVDQILLSAEDMASQESTKIWRLFQPKFSFLGGLFGNLDNFRVGLLAICKSALEDGVQVVELRKGLGGKGSVTEELDVYQSVLDEMKQIDSEFELTLIIATGKFSEKSVEKQLENYKLARENYSFVSGFDLVGEEDALESVYHFKDLILEAQNDAAKSTGSSSNDFQIFLHSGESTSRFNENLYDSILLGTKRIGHGIGIANHPYLIDIINEKDIGIEVCPISNFVLGYTLDMRWHPIRILMQKGVAVTINSDDPTFWGYSDLSLDFTYAFIAWQLDLKDIKQLAINSIKQSSVNEKSKNQILKRFDQKWQRFIGTTLENMNVSI
eukprot:CAMPEP_0205821576 /NCGR_PEP_ID=MMETSP0206-20130828/8512_1 /ASSEMBLY_ACC=CAM_ASM_000279 /TAXON_ID=36767 /ORGANISM="Euplotes focardii, Strain TN1" /LENGTH=496 /DNA_ID=CAMNT_0053117153 /DNA_START=87 /DNA_END=1577 /DNA_ORIENTATION=+